MTDATAIPRLLRIEDAATALAIHRTLLYGLIRSGAIPVVRIGRAVRISVAALDRFVESLEEQPNQPLPVESATEKQVSHAR